MKCPNCDQTILPDDVTCWQCGHQLKDEPAAPNVKESWQDAEQPNMALAVYVGLTAFIIIMAIVITISLGRQPLVQAASQVPAEGWQIAVNEPRSLIVHLPASWHYYDAFDVSNTTTFNELVVGNQLFSQATRPLGEFVDDAQPIFLATVAPLAEEPNPNQFVLVVRSVSLNQWSATQALAAAQEGGVEIVEGENVEDFDKSHAFLQVRIPFGEGEIGCRQQYIDGAGYGMLVTACGDNANISADILKTFQRLDRE